MKKILLMLGVVVSACSNLITVRTDYDRDVDISKFSSFNWLSGQNIEERNNPLYYNELSDKRIKRSVTDQLKSKGYLLDEGGASLIVHYHIVIEDKTAIRTDPYGYFYGPYWMRNQTDVYQYQEGTLIIDVMDAKNKALLWRGWAISALSSNQEMTEELIQSAVNKIFVSFPKFSTQR